MTDNGNGLGDSLAKKLKSSTFAKDGLNGSSDENSLSKQTEAKNENIALLFPNSSCSPGESVFSIDHILESIFAELDRKTLLSCRLISRRSLLFSSERLRKIVTLKFYRYFRFRNRREESGLFCHGPWRPDRTTKSLTTLMSSSNNFPCTSFSFDNGDRDYISARKIDPMPQRFFSAQGAFITKLQLSGEILLSDLKRFFLIQAPNLEELKFFNAEFRFADADYRLKKSETEEERRRRRESLFDETTIKEKPVFKSFKKYIILGGSGVPDNFLQQLLACSPNLNEVYVELESLHNLLQPVNRLHLLKKLELNIREDSIEPLMALANNHQDNWAVQKLILYNFEVDKDDTAMAFQAAKAVIKILKGCSATCQMFRWHEGFANFQIPPMHGVKKVHFSGYGDLPVNIFPAGVSLGDSFPDLRSIKISMEFPFSLCEEYLSIRKMFGEDDPVPVPLPNVKKVFLEIRTAQSLLESIQEKFPNAIIKSMDDAEARSDDEKDDVETKTEVTSDDEEDDDDDEWY